MPRAPATKFHKGVNREVLRKYIGRLPTAGIDVAVYGDVVPIHQPVARHTKRPAEGYGFGLFVWCIIGRGGGVR